MVRTATLCVLLALAACGAPTDPSYRSSRTGHEGDAYIAAGLGMMGGSYQPAPRPRQTTCNRFGYTVACTEW